MKKRIVLCADDYGQAPAISQGIINLIQNHRLTATSCMVNMSCWQEHAKWILPYRQQVDIGLHFNLTEGQALSQEYRQAYGPDFQPLSRLLVKAMVRRLDKRVIAAECHAQISCFEQAMGFLPQFLDGHQHSHQFPVVRDAVIQVYQERLRQQNAYIRWLNITLSLRDVFRGWKRFIIHASGTRAFKVLLDENKIPHNQSFTGIYSFSLASQYARFFPGFLSEVTDKGILMCHPGLQASGTNDVIADARFAEYQYLSSEAFVAESERANVSFTRMNNGDQAK